MIHTEMNGCRIDILPIIKGLVSEYDRVKGHITDDYDCIAVSLRISIPSMHTSSGNSGRSMCLYPHTGP